jgi:RNA polymerase sigma-70 factor (ECF subfamily)
MPPELIQITGRAQVVRFFATVPAGGRLDTIRLVTTGANGRPALAAYLPDKSARCHGYGIMVFTTTRDGIATITGFPSPACSPGSACPLPASDGGEDARPGRSCDPGGAPPAPSSPP